jgi:molybdopterin converting factor small subunit
MRVNVRLFGILAILAKERSVALQLDEPATLGDVLAELAQRFGREFADHIFRVEGEMHSYCGVFVNNAQVRDLKQELPAGGAAAEVGMILLMASEGG